MNETTQLPKAVRLLKTQYQHSFRRSGRAIADIGLVVKVIQKITGIHGERYEVVKVDGKRSFWVPALECETVNESQLPVPATKLTKEDIKANFTVLNAGLQEIRTDYTKRYLEMFMATFESHLAKLQEVGMDAQKYAPYPSSTNISRVDYLFAVHRYRYVRKYFVSAEVARASYMRNAPYIVKEASDTRTRLANDAKDLANIEVDSYIMKMAKKIDAKASSLTVTGRLWEGSRLTVQTDDGQQVWNTKFIINRSFLGTIFNQWPTRKES